MKIGVDLDGVLADMVGVLIPILSEKIGEEIRREDITDYNFERDGVKITDVISSLTDEQMLSIKPIDGAVAVMDALVMDYGYNVGIVTSRPESCRDVTLQWLDKNDIPYDFFVCTDGNGKQDVDVDILIDDHLDFLAGFLSRGDTGRKAILFDQPWNRAMDLTHENLVDQGDISIIYTWKEMLGRIHNLFLIHSRANKVTMEFRLPEAEQDFYFASKGKDWARAMRDLDDQLRNWIKYEGFKFEVPEELKEDISRMNSHFLLNIQKAALEEARSYLFECLKDNNVSFEDYE